MRVHDEGRGRCGPVRLGARAGGERGTPAPTGLLALQRAVGNSAVAALVGRHRPDTARVAVQREAGINYSYTGQPGQSMVYGYGPGHPITVGDFPVVKATQQVLQPSIDSIGQDVECAKEGIPDPATDPYQAVEWDDARKDWIVGGLALSDAPVKPLFARHDLAPGPGNWFYAHFPAPCYRTEIYNTQTDPSSPSADRRSFTVKVHHYEKWEAGLTAAFKIADLASMVLPLPGNAGRLVVRLSQAGFRAIMGSAGVAMKAAQAAGKTAVEIQAARKGVLGAAGEAANATKAAGKSDQEIERAATASAQAKAAGTPPQATERPGLKGGMRGTGGGESQPSPSAAPPARQGTPTTPPHSTDTTTADIHQPRGGTEGVPGEGLSAEAARGLDRVRTLRQLLDQMSVTEQGARVTNPAATDKVPANYLFKHLDGMEHGGADSPPSGQPHRIDSPKPAGLDHGPLNADIVESRYGITKNNQARFQAMADRFNLVIDVRPTNPDSVPHLKVGAFPKPQAIKAKTINDLDIALGAPADMKGVVGFFRPDQLHSPKVGDPDYVALKARYDQRVDEYRQLQEPMRKLGEDGKFQVRDNGVVMGKNQAGTYVPVAGDHDIFQIRTVDGKRLLDPYRDDLERILTNRDMGVQHGAHMDWNPIDEWARKNVYEKIIGSHGPGQEPLVRYAPGRPPELVHSD